MPRPVTITDDRGARVPLFAPGALDLREPENAELADAYMRASETTNEHGWNRHLKGREALWLLAPVLLIPGLIMVMSVFPGMPHWMTYLVVVPVMWGFIVLRARAHLNEHSHRYAQAFLTRSRCASCGYALGGVDAAGEVLVCPECGAGWRVERVGLAVAGGERPAGGPPARPRGARARTCPDDLRNTRRPPPSGLWRAPTPASGRASRRCPRQGSNLH